MSPRFICIRTHDMYFICRYTQYVLNRHILRVCMFTYTYYVYVMYVHIQLLRVCDVCSHTITCMWCMFTYNCYVYVMYVHIQLLRVCDVCSHTIITCMWCMFTYTYYVNVMVTHGTNRYMLCVPTYSVCDVNVGIHNIYWLVPCDYTISTMC